MLIIALWYFTNEFDLTRRKFNENSVSFKAIKTLFIIKKRRLNLLNHNINMISHD